MRSSLQIAVAFALAGVSASAAFGAPIDLVAHRAVYDLKLAPMSAGGVSDISDVNGRMVFEITGGACEGYTVNSRFVVEQTDAEGRTTLIDLRTSSFESASGDSMDFLAQSYTNQVLVNDVKGSATTNGSLEIKLVSPQVAKLKIDRTVLFPTAYLNRLIEAARGGKPVMTADLFDGSEDGNKVYETTSVIGPEIKGPAVGTAAKIGDSRRWPVTTSYFDANATGDRTPEYTFSAQIWENGVSSDMVMNFGDFALAGTLSRYEPLAAPACK
ncbi:cell envelope integrity EipB family protein [Chthonobacter albigriseus]|uniref:cell envelope integrity EipB family protein n=1 Tax=Chthonobacter albigriseus TaxID=1683161 RepID=UPI0015EF69B3|nr:cell envelope integrity EipB family protein [Chthonobacter albigriseus]